VSDQWGDLCTFLSKGWMPPVLALIGPSASSRQIPSGARGRQEFVPRSVTIGPVGLGSVCVQAALKARTAPLGHTAASACSSATKTFKAALRSRRASWLGVGRRWSMLR
jgi:hypothetical protein